MNQRVVLFFMLGFPFYARGEPSAGGPADTPTYHVEQRPSAGRTSPFIGFIR